VTERTWPTGPAASSTCAGVGVARWFPHEGCRIGEEGKGHVYRETAEPERSRGVVAASFVRESRDAGGEAKQGAIFVTSVQCSRNAKISEGHDVLVSPRARVSSCRMRFFVAGRGLATNAWPKRRGGGPGRPAHRLEYYLRAVCCGSATQSPTARQRVKHVGRDICAA
jgi:hypothetical protein